MGVGCALAHGAFADRPRFGLATIAEVIVLRQADLGVIYIAIITVETLMVLTLAALIGEGLNAKQMLGAAFVLVGIFIVGE